ERCWELARPATFDILRNRRLGLVATAGVDAAIWDAVGKALGQPLWRVWGGYRSRLPMIAIGGHHDSCQSVPEAVAELKAMGHARPKAQVALPLRPACDSGTRGEGAPPGGAGFHPRPRPQQEVDARRGDPLRAHGRGRVSRLAGEALPRGQRPPLAARRPYCR